jgi:hypothetical protein
MIDEEEANALLLIYEDAAKEYALSPNGYTSCRLLDIRATVRGAFIGQLTVQEATEEIREMDRWDWWK